jgi:hypothetical protein
VEKAQKTKKSKTTKKSQEIRLGPLGMGGVFIL